MNETIDNVFYLMLVSHFLAVIAGMCIVRIIDEYINNKQ